MRIRGQALELGEACRPRPQTRGAAAVEGGNLAGKEGIAREAGKRAPKGRGQADRGE